MIESLGRGGAERLLVTTLSHLDTLRFEVVVASLFGPSSLAGEIRDLGIEVVELGLGGPKDLARAVLPLRRLIRRRRIDVVHTHLFTANVAGRLAARGLAPVVTTLHNPDYGAEGPAHGFGLRRLLDGSTAHLCPPLYLAVSEHVRDDYRAHLGLSGVRVLHNYLDVDGFRRRAEGVDPSGVRHRLGLRDEDFVGVHVGRFHRQKGQDVLLRAFAGLAPSDPSLRLVLTGDGPDKVGIEALASSLGIAASVTFTGQVPDPVELYAAADVFLFPSRYEAFGMALLEAMAMGLPSVVSSVGGILEVTTGETSIHVTPEDEQGLAEGLRAIRGDRSRRLTMGAAARERASAFDISRLLPRLEGIYATA